MERDLSGFQNRVREQTILLRTLEFEVLAKKKEVADLRSEEKSLKQQLQELTRLTANLDQIERENEDLIRKKHKLETDVDQQEGRLLMFREEDRKLRAEMDCLMATCDQLEMQKKDLATQVI